MRIPRRCSIEKIFEPLVGEEERHFDPFENQFDNVKRFGAELPGAPVVWDHTAAIGKSLGDLAQQMSSSHIFAQRLKRL